MLWEKLLKDYIFMVKQPVSDGQGGFVTKYIDGVEFKSAVTINNNIQTRIAEKQGVTSLYTVQSYKKTKLEFHDIIKEKETGKIYRITSNSSEMETPEYSTFEFNQVSAELWELVE